jgi:hypothetical protein
MKLNGTIFVMEIYKSQITSTPPEKRRASKLQINLKLQYPMTQTVWNFEFWSL